MTETIGKREDDAAFEEAVWSRFWEPLSGEPVHLPMKSMAEMNPRLVLRHAFDAGMERGISKRGCCEGDGDE